MDDRVVNLEIEGAVAVVTIDRPPVNALNRAVISQLGDIIDQVAADDSVRALVLRGAGPKAFVAGADIAEFPALTVDTAELLARRGQDVTVRLQAMPKPSIAAVHGFALGGGCELALACDFRIAAESARFGQPEINLGIIPGYGGTQRLARLVGASRAKYLCITGEQVTAQEAYRIGLADAVVPDAELFSSAMALANKLAAKAPVALGLIKRAVDEGLDKEFGVGMDLEACLFGEVFGTADHIEGVNAFLEKRPPRFTGK